MNTNEEKSSRITTHEMVIERLKFPNKGVGQLGEKEITVKNTLPGQVVLVGLPKKRHKGEGKLLDIVQKSPMETLDGCKEFRSCGGCAYQSIPYDQEAELKKKLVESVLKNCASVQEFHKASRHSAYRNKVELAFGDNGAEGQLSLGMRKRGSYYEVSSISDCNLIPEEFRKMADTVLEFFKSKNESFYHRRKHTGCCRHLVLRRGESTGEILINLVTSENHPELSELVESLLGLQLPIVGILHTVNKSLADAVIPESVQLLHGQAYFHETLCDLRFKIGPFSFFQTNSKGAEALYQTVVKLLGDCTGKTLFDLYCGTGTIAQILSKNTNAKAVYGVELVQEAVDMAKENALNNGLSNCEFIAGDVLKVIDELALLHNTPDLIILDPPREGLHPKLPKKLEALSPARILYISCMPTSLARDLPLLMEAGYEVVTTVCHDMFPRSCHLETVVLMSRVESF